MNQPTYQPRVTRLRPPVKPRWKLRIVVALTFVTVALVIVDASLVGPIRQFITRAPVRERFQLPNGETLTVHAVLGDSNRSVSFRGLTITPYGAPVMLVMSCKDEKTGRLSDWSWLKHIEVEDAYGAIVEVQISEIIQVWQDGSSRHESQVRKLDKLAFTAPKEVYCLVRLPIVETLKPCEYSVIDTNDEIVATIESHLPPPKPIEGFYDHSHNLIAENAPWKVEIVEMNGSWSPAHDDFPAQFNVQPSKIYFDYNGTRVDKENLVLLGEQLINALGQQTSIYSRLNRQPLWKYEARVARSDYMTNRQDPDLKALGRIEHPNAASEVSKPEGLRQVRSLTFMPIGKHERVVFDVSDTKDGSVDFSSRQNKGRKLMRSSSGSSGGSVYRGYEYEHTSRYRYTNGDDALDLKLASKTNQPTQLSVDTKRPMLMLQLEEASNDYLINLFAFDQFNRALQVDALPDYVDKLPMFLIDAESDIEYLDLYYSIEPVVPIELYMKPPTKGLVFPETGTTWYSLTGSRDGWILKHQETFK